MLTTAQPIFENVSASFMDPVSLADQQAPGVVSLIVVRYPAPEADPSPLGSTYDTFVAASGQVLVVARTTVDYRFPVMPAAALSRFFQHRDAGEPVSLAMYELAETDCARFLETVFYSECLKLHVDGPASAPLVARQLAQSSCANGVLEVNDFSDPAAPRLRLVDLAELAAHASQPTTDDGLASAMADMLDGVTGRVLLYDRAKNKATLPDRAGGAFDLDGVIEQAGRLAGARRAASGEAVSAATANATLSRDVSSSEAQTESVEDYLRERADRPRLVDPAHPHATGLGALVAELQGLRPTTSSPTVATDPSENPDAPGPPDEGVEPDPADLSPDSSTARPDPQPLAASPATLPSPTPASGGRHVLATELDRLRTDAFELFETAVGRERAVAHEAHVLDENGIASPVAADDTVRYLRALLCDEPPKRWHFFKRSRAKTYEEVAGKLLAFHAANGHVDSPVVHEVTRLWTRLHK